MGLTAAAAAAGGRRWSAAARPPPATPYPGPARTLDPGRSGSPAASAPAPRPTWSSGCTFDDYPDPDTVRSDSLLLTTGTLLGPGRSTASICWPRRPSSDPGGRSAPSRLHGAPHPALHSLTAARPRIRPASSEPARERPRSPPVTPAFADVQAMFDRRCGGGCHLDTRSRRRRMPPTIRPRRPARPSPPPALSLCARGERGMRWWASPRGKTKRCCGFGPGQPPPAICCASSCPRRQEADRLRPRWGTGTRPATPSKMPR